MFTKDPPHQNFYIYLEKERKQEQDISQSSVLW